MTMFGKLAALGSASVAAASVAWVVTASNAADKQGADGAPQRDPARVEGRLICAGQDSVLRFLAEAKTCPDRQVRVDVEEAEEELLEWEDQAPDEKAPDRGGPRARKIAELERRVRELEQRPQFEVVDKAGQPIFRVSQDTVLVYNKAQTPVAALRATPDGGYFIGRSPGGLAASIGASGVRSGVRITEAGITRSYAGKQQYGNYALTFPSPASGNIAAIGESRAGTGAIVVGDFRGTVLGSITGTDGKGAIGASNSGGAPVISMTEGATRGGLLSIGDATSEPMVRMGVAQDRYGIVLTGPRAGFPLIPGSGLPGSYIMGCAGKGKDCGPEGMER